MGILSKRAQNLPAYGTMLSELYSPNMPILFQRCGFDFFIVDCEHGCFDYGQVAAMTSTANSAGIDILVRIPAIAREYFNKYLDMGVSGLIVPMVSTESQTEEAMSYTRYSPLGKRGLSTTRAHTGYKKDDFDEYMRQANEKVLLYCQIETTEGLRNISRIAAVPHINGLLVGPNDLSDDMGIRGSFHNEEFLKALKIVAGGAAKSGKDSGMITSDSALVQTCQTHGMNIFCWSSELGMLLNSPRPAFIR